MSRRRKGQIPSTIRAYFLDISPLRQCAYCGEDAATDWMERVYCKCKCRVYCSPVCSSKDAHQHGARCNRISEMSTGIEGRIVDLERAVGEDHIHRLFDGNFPRNRLGIRMDASRRDEVIGLVEGLFVARENLIRELILEVSCRGDEIGSFAGGGLTGEHYNRLAYDVAIMHCKDLIFLRGNCDLILHLYLLAGTIDEWYDASCHLARKGLVTYVDGSKLDILDDLNLGLHRFCRYCGWKVSESYFYSNNIDRNKHNDRGFFIGRPTHWQALTHIFLVKYLLHVSMQDLVAIDDKFLNNRDCMALIGEYAGMKKQWIVRGGEKSYRDQAYEVIRFFFCMECYFDGFHGTASSELEKTRAFAAEYIPVETGRVVVDAIEAGLIHLRKIKLSQKRDESMSNSRWMEIIDGYEADHRLIYVANIRPALFLAIKRINTMAGYDALGMSVDPSCDNFYCSLTAFMTEGIKTCGNDSDSFFFNLFGYMDLDMDWDDEEDAIDQTEEFISFQNRANFSQAILACMAIEKKLAQCHYHKIKLHDQARGILNLLPGGKDRYTSLQPAPEDHASIFDQFIGPNADLNHLCKRTRSLFAWLPDVTKVVDALFVADLATEDILSALFGRSGYVSYRIWELQQQRMSRSQNSIVPFVSRHRPWKVGCIDNDHSLGLKIQYLNKFDRRKRFADIKEQMPVGNAICTLEPSLGQFARKFGWDNLDVEPFLCDFGEHEKPTHVASKKHRHELDDFHNMDEACRHFFDAASLEEAMWDSLGIPRVVILNGSREKMEKSGWIYCGINSHLGDKTVRLGNRVAHVYSESSCTIWKEGE